MQSPAELGVLRLNLRCRIDHGRIYISMAWVLVLRPWLPRLFAKLTDRQRKRLSSRGVTTKNIGKNGKTHVFLGCVWAPEIQQPHIWMFCSMFECYQPRSGGPLLRATQASPRGFGEAVCKFHLEFKDPIITRSFAICIHARPERFWINRVGRAGTTC